MIIDYKIFTRINSIYITQDAAPMRMKGAHYINTPVGFETVYNLFKSFFNEKNRSRVSRRIFKIVLKKVSIVSSIIFTPSFIEIVKKGVFYNTFEKKKTYRAYKVVFKIFMPISEILLRFSLIL